MLRVLSHDPHGDRLSDLLLRFRAQESSMTRVLEELQVELEFWHREASLARSGAWQLGSWQQGSWQQTNDLLHRCTLLQAECDQLATELVHVRMAVAGTAEELADHESRMHHSAAAG